MWHPIRYLSQKVNDHSPSHFSFFPTFLVACHFEFSTQDQDHSKGCVRARSSADGERQRGRCSRGVRQRIESPSRRSAQHLCCIRWQQQTRLWFVDLTSHHPIMVNYDLGQQTLRLLDRQSVPVILAQGRSSKHRTSSFLEL